VDRIADMAGSLSVAPGIEGTEPGLTMGAMISEAQRDRAEGMVTEAISQGANLAAGGRRPKLPGAFLEPTVLVDVTPRMRVAQEQVFGPVLSVQKFRSEEGALELANGTPYGHSAGVFTRDIDRAVRAARKLRAGQVFVNEWYAGGIETPSGGTGRSGHGAVTGRAALLNYVQTRNIAVKVGQ
jgi:aldehyde dehydrogenase (NAD+)